MSLVVIVGIALRDLLLSEVNRELRDELSQTRIRMSALITSGGSQQRNFSEMDSSNLFIMGTAIHRPGTDWSQSLCRCRLMVDHPRCKIEAATATQKKVGTSQLMIVSKTNPQLVPFSL